jgi:hypothetical protein
VNVTTPYRHSPFKYLSLVGRLIVTVSAGGACHTVT